MLWGNFSHAEIETHKKNWPKSQSMWHRGQSFLKSSSALPPYPDSNALKARCCTNCHPVTVSATSLFYILLSVYALPGPTPKLGVCLINRHHSIMQGAIREVRIGSPRLSHRLCRWPEIRSGTLSLGLCYLNSKMSKLGSVSKISISSNTWWLLWYLVE